MSRPNEKRFSSETTRTKNSERGSLIVELALSVPILLGLAAGMTDLTMYFQQQSKLSRIVYETARFASQAHALELCEEECGYKTGHLPVVAFANSLLAAQGFDTNTADIITKHYTDPNDPDEERTVAEIEIEVQYNSVVASFSPMPLNLTNNRAKAFGPYFKS
jgi:hypothetical protein